MSVVGQSRKQRDTRRKVGRESSSIKPQRTSDAKVTQPTPRSVPRTSYEGHFTGKYSTTKHMGQQQG